MKVFHEKSNIVFLQFQRQGKKSSPKYEIPKDHILKVRVVNTNDQGTSIYSGGSLK